MQRKWRLVSVAICFFASLLLTISLATPSYAHWADLSVAEVVVGATETKFTLTFPTGLTAFADDNDDRQLSPQEVSARQVELQTFLQQNISITDGKGRRSDSLTIQPFVANALPLNPNITSTTHSALLLIYRWSEPVDSLVIRYNLFIPGISTARCLATITVGDHVQSFVFTPENREYSSVRPFWQQAGSFVLLGIEHILTGYDHVLFLLSLLLLGGGLNYLLKVVTAFTLAHCLTLSLAVLNIVTLPSRWVESAIALSIVYVAAETFWRRDLQKRWLVTFGFGLVHGLGFASILKEIDLTSSNLVLALASFNIGVEIGQIAIVSIAFFCLTHLKKVSWELTFRRWLSAGIVTIGLFWFAQRAFL